MEDCISFEFKVQYETKMGEEIYILGDDEDFGRWNDCKLKLDWTKNNIWIGKYKMPKSKDDIHYKFVCVGKDYKKWEKRPNRTLSNKHLEYIGKNDDGDYVLDCQWDAYKINFNIHYDIKPSSSCMMIIGGNDPLGNWNNNDNFDNRQMSLDQDKMMNFEGQQIQGFWTKTVSFHFKDEKQYDNLIDFEYRYLIFDHNSKSAIWEREPNRHIKILLDLDDEENKFYCLTNPTEYKILTNSYIEILDMNFISELKMDKIGDEPIYIGPCPQSENDLDEIKDRGITAILNLQNDKEMGARQINKDFIYGKAKEKGISIEYFSIEEYSQEDLVNKLKKVADKLNDMMDEGNSIYVHCTEGMSRSASAVIIYLVLHKNYTLEQARDYVKQYHNNICPNYKALNIVVEKYAKGREMKNEIL